MTPPRLGTWLLSIGLDAGAAEAIGGDLAEEFERRVARGSVGAARRWYLTQALSAVVWRRLSRFGPDLPPGPSRQRRSHFMDELRQDLRFAWRTLRAAPAFSVFAILTLAIGIGAATVIGTAADRVVLRAVPYAGADRLVVVGSGGVGDAVGNVGFETALDWRARVSAFDQLVLIRSWLPTLVDASGAERLNGVRVSWDYFRLLGVRPALGRDFDRSEDDPTHLRVVILSDSLWRRRFGARPEVVGTSISLGGAQSYLVAGVMPATFDPVIATHFYGAPDLWAPLGYAVGGASACRSCQHLHAIARLRPGATVSEASTELAAVQQSLRLAHPADYSQDAAVVRGLTDEIAGRLRRPMQVLVVAAGFLLLIACTNVAGLLIARAADRERELAVRSALGAGRGRIVRQLLTESFVLAAIATVGGVALARWGLSMFASSPLAAVPRLEHAAADPVILLIGAVTATLALAIFGVLPAWTSARTDLQGVLREGRQSGSRRALRAREGLMTAQIAVALLLVAGAGLMYRTVDRLLATSPGFDPRGVTTASISVIGPRWAKTEQVLEFQDELLRRVRAMPGVESAALAGQIPLGGNYDRRGFHVKGRAENSGDAPEVELYGVTPDDFHVMRIPLRRGRLLSDEDTAARPGVMVIGETTAATIFPGEDPIGQQVQFGGTDGPFWTIVGVVGDVRHYALDAAPTPQMYVSEGQSTDSFFTLLVRSSSSRASGLGPAIRREVAAMAPEVPVSRVIDFEDLVRASIASRRLLMLLLGAFALTALALAAVGLYGVVSQSVASRRREFGIRVALGASRRDIFGLVLRRGAQLVGLGIAAGLTASVWLGGLLGSQLYETAPHDPRALLAAIAVLAIVALLAHVVPARRALRVDPSLTLRNE